MSNEKKLFNFALILKYRTELMGIATVMILFFHSAISFDFLQLPVLQKLGEAIRSLGRAGVDIFLFLSGIGLYCSMEKEPRATRFYRKRAARILPPVFIVSFLYYACADHPIRLLDYFSDSLLISFFTRGDRTFWFVALLIVLYIMFPLIYKILKRSRTIGFIAVMTAAIALNGLLLLLCPSFYAVTEIAWTRVPVFLIGAWMGDMALNRKTCSRAKLMFAAIPLVLISLALLFVLHDFLHPRFYLARPLFSVVGVFVTLLFCGILDRIRGVFLKSILRFFGTHSLEFYLLYERMAAVAYAFVYQDKYGIIFSIAVFIMTMIGVVILKSTVDRLHAFSRDRLA